jgi:hypothetical protein
MLKKDEWLPIIRAMYNRADAEALALSITSHATARQQRNAKQASGANGVVSSRARRSSAASNGTGRGEGLRKANAGEARSYIVPYIHTYIHTYVCILITSFARLCCYVPNYFLCFWQLSIGLFPFVAQPSCLMLPSAVGLSVTCQWELA